MVTMERSDPALVPEWLKSNSNLSGGNCLNQNSSWRKSSLHTDDHVNKQHTRRRHSFNNGGHESPRSVIADSNRKAASNGSMRNEKNLHSRHYSSFGRSHRDGGWDADLSGHCNQERSFRQEQWDRYSSTNSFPNRLEKDALRRTQSMISGKRAELWSREIVADPRSNENGFSNAGVAVAGRAQKAVLEKDHHSSIGAEERPGTPDIARTASPSMKLSSVQNFAFGSSRDRWTSALAEVPSTVGSNSMIHSSVHQHVPARLSSTVAPSTSGLNMAETLAQAPSRANSAPQISLETRRLEELAIKKSRRLIPLTPLVPKLTVLNADKSKPAVRSEMMASKGGHQQLSSYQLADHSLRGGHTKSDTVKSCPVVAPLSIIAPPRSISSIKRAAPDHKASDHPVIYAPTVEKRSMVSQAQSRNDFFDLMRKKSSMNFSSVSTDPTHVENTNKLTIEVSTAIIPKTDNISMSDPSCCGFLTENGPNMASNGAVSEESRTYPNNGDKFTMEVIHLDEKERAFLCSLGWDENAGGDALTEEEISAFYKEYTPLKPSTKTNCRIWQPKLPTPLMSHLGSFESDELSSSDSDSDA
ncbi:mediator of RNA polymerase II transcription subunit-like protein [Thalictrum thalictroides]|uniref:Mediator of RNA polymerase II transcription subunit-like protein n=1 Tax=Thalictrum thalictroides TaxID=46969 RepID=A0A7J6WB77_THATH|nr:mediator of RNA polymerase II transcription subunit-like protein [Thalictrum thalictroides]